MPHGGVRATLGGPTRQKRKLLAIQLFSTPANLMEDLTVISDYASGAIDKFGYAGSSCTCKSAARIAVFSPGDNDR